MSFVLDTSVLIELRRGNTTVASLVKQLIKPDAPDASITYPTFSEYYFGCLDASEIGQKDCLEFLSSFRHLTLTKGSAIQYAQLMYRYRKKGVTLGPVDTLIASITIDSGMTLITLDKGFTKIRELKKIVLSQEKSGQ